MAKHLSSEHNWEKSQQTVLKPLTDSEKMDASVSDTSLSNKTIEIDLRNTSEISCETADTSETFVRPTPTKTNVQTDSKLPFRHSGRQNERDQKLSTEAKQLEVAKFLIDFMMPLNSVDKESFQSLLNVFHPGSLLISSRTISNVIQTLYSQTQEELKEIIKGIPHCHLSVDAWKCPNGLERFGVVAHGLNDKWNLHHFFLGFIETDHPSQMHVLTEKIESIAQQFLIKNPTVVSNSTKLMAALAKALKWKTHACFLSQINLALWEGLQDEEYLTLLSKSKAQLEKPLHCNPPPATRSALEKQHCNTSRIENQDPLLDKGHRSSWMSDYLALQELCPVHQKFQQQSVSGKASSNPPKQQPKVSQCQEVRDFLSVFHVFAEMISSSSYCSISTTEPYVRSILEEKCQFREKDSSMMARIKEKVRSKLEELRKLVSSESRELINVCTALDPNFLYLFKEQNESREEMTKLLTSFLKELQPNSIQQPPCKRSKTCHFSEEAFDIQARVYGRAWVQSQKDWDDSPEKLEVTRYMTSAQPGSLDCLQWWTKNKDVYPLLSKLALRLLSVPANSLPCPQAFSSCLKPSYKKTESLCPEDMEVLLFLNQNQGLPKGRNSTPPQDTIPSQVHLHPQVFIRSNFTAALNHSPPKNHFGAFSRKQLSFLASNLGADVDVFLVEPLGKKVVEKGARPKVSHCFIPEQTAPFGALAVHRRGVYYLVLVWRRKTGGWNTPLEKQLVKNRKNLLRYFEECLRPQLQAQQRSTVDYSCGRAMISYGWCYFVSWFNGCCHKKSFRKDPLGGQCQLNPDPDSFGLKPGHTLETGLYQKHKEFLKHVALETGWWVQKNFPAATDLHPNAAPSCLHTPHFTSHAVALDAKQSVHRDRHNQGFTNVLNFCSPQVRYFLGLANYRLADCKSCHCLGVEYSSDSVFSLYSQDVDHFVDQLDPCVSGQRVALLFYGHGLREQVHGQEEQVELWKNVVRVREEVLARMRSEKVWSTLEMESVKEEYNKLLQGVKNSQDASTEEGCLKLMEDMRKTRLNRQRSKPDISKA